MKAHGSHLQQAKRALIIAVFSIAHRPPVIPLWNSLTLSQTTRPSLRRLSQPLLPLHPMPGPTFPPLPHKVLKSRFISLGAVAWVYRIH